MNSANKGKVYLIGPTESILTKRGNRFPNIAEYLNSQGYNVEYYTSNFYHAEKRFFSVKKIDAEKLKINYSLKVLNVIGYQKNISIKRVLNNLFFSMHIFFLLLIKCKKNDKILLPSRPVELIFFISVLKKIKGAEIYLDIQDIWPDALEIENRSKRKVFNFYCNLFLYPSLKNYNGTIHTAPSFVNWLRRYSSNTPSTFLPLGWEDKRWNAITSNDSVENTRIELVCVAQLQHQIDVMPIIRAIKGDFKYHFTVIGEDGNGERYNEVSDYIQENKISNVTIIGKVERNEMVRLLKNKDLGILPMITPSIPNKIFDYLGSKLPIIVLGENDSSRFVCNNNIGWTCNFNSDELKTLLSTISCNDIKTKRKNVLEIRDQYSRKNLHTKIKDLLN